MADLFSTSVSGLLAAQRQLATTSHNVSNVNTEGFSRQRALQDARIPNGSGAGFIGTGVNTTTVQRLFDQAREVSLRQSTSDFNQQDVKAEFSGNIDNLLADTQAGLSPALQSFFNAAQDLSNDPTSASARQVLLSEGQGLAARFDLLDQRLRTLDGDINTKLKLDVESINNLSGGIARLNQEIIQAQGRTGQPPNDLMDKRDTLIRQLSEKISTQAVPQADGSVNVFIGNGQGLVIGNESSALTTRPNAFDPQQVDIVYQGGSGAPVDITRNLTGGSIGGLLDVRKTVIDPTRNDLGRLAVTITETFNAQQRLGLQFDGSEPRLGNDFFKPFSPEIVRSDNNSSTALPEVSFNAGQIGDLKGSDYRAVFNSADNAWRVTRLSDGESFPGIAANGSATIDGLDFDFSDFGAAANGDTFVIRPTRLAAGEMEVSLRRPSQIAAANPLIGGATTDATGQTSNRGEATVKNIDVQAMTDTQRTAIRNDGPFTFTFDGVTDTINSDLTLAAGDSVDVAQDSNGFNITVNSAAYGEFSFRVDGVPRDGDTFQLGLNSAGKGDNANALKLASLANANTMNGASATYQEFYGAVVGRVGNETMRAQTNRDAQQTLLTQAEQAREEVSGVNLEEEAANLLKFQQAFQANAQTITIANTLFQTVLDAVRR